jgi:hypothetical protein
MSNFLDSYKNYISQQDIDNLKIIYKNEMKGGASINGFFNWLKSFFIIEKPSIIIDESNLSKHFTFQELNKNKIENQCSTLVAKLGADFFYWNKNPAKKTVLNSLNKV